MNNPFDPAHIQEEKAEREARRLKLRTNLLITIFCAVLAGFVAVLYQTQIVSGDSYRANSSVRVPKTEVVNSVRGEILDRYGRVLVTNEVSYYVTLDWNAMGSDRLDILTRLLDICREEGVEWSDTLPISRSAPWGYTADIPLASQAVDEEGNPAVDEKGEAVFNKTALGRLAEKCGWVKHAEKSNLTAGELLTLMCQTFGLIEKTPRPRLERPELAGMMGAAGQGLGLTDQGGGITQENRELAGVLYELYLRRHEVDNSQYVFARGVDITFISKVKENALAGVRIETATARRYETSYAAHVLGYTGKINPDNWAIPWTPPWGWRGSSWPLRSSSTAPAAPGSSKRTAPATPSARSGGKSPSRGTTWCSPWISPSRPPPRTCWPSMPPARRSRWGRTGSRSPSRAWPPRWWT